MKKSNEIPGTSVSEVPSTALLELVSKIEAEYNRAKVRTEEIEDIETYDKYEDFAKCNSLREAIERELTWASALSLVKKYFSNVELGHE
jgi:hypothetical protein